MLNHTMYSCAVMLLALAITPPLVLYKERGQVARAPSMSKGLAWLHVSSIAFAVLFARFFIFDLVVSLGPSHPHEGFLLGVLVLCIAFGTVPLVSKFFSNSSSARRLLASTAAFGLMLTLLR